MADPVSRRSILAGAGVLTLLPRAPAVATAQAMREAMSAIVGAAAPRAGKVLLDVPPLVENGNTVPLTVSVDSPMTEADHVKAIHILNQKNPQPHVISIALGPRAGRAKVQTRIK